MSGMIAYPFHMKSTGELLSSNFSLFKSVHRGLCLARSGKFLFLGRPSSEDISLQFNAPFHSLHYRCFMSLYVLRLTLLGHSRQQQTKNDFLQKTDTYRPITRPVFVQPDLSQGYYYPDSDETSATSLRLT